MDSAMDVARTQSETAVLVDSVSQIAERYEMITKEQFKRNLERKKRLELANQMRDAYMKAQLAFEMRCTENSLIDHDDENGSAAWIGVTKQ